MDNSFNGSVDFMKIRHDLEAVVIKHIGSKNFFDKFFDSFMWYSLYELASDITNAKLKGIYNRLYDPLEKVKV